MVLLLVFKFYVAKIGKIAIIMKKLEFGGNPLLEKGLIINKDFLQKIF
jgi:hypothetical protein